MIFVDVILPVKLKSELTYSLPDDLCKKTSIGSWVNVRLRGKKFLAVVCKISETTGLDVKTVLPVDSLIDISPVSESEIGFWRKIARYYMCSIGEVFKAAYSTAFQRQIDSVKSRQREESDKTVDYEASPLLSDAQLQAFSQIQKAFENHRIAYLHGVTGSGKTEIYIKFALDTLSKGKNVLYLVPEIAVSRQLKNRLEKIFGSSLLVFHSKQTAAGKKGILKKLSDTASGPFIVLGTRSSIFLPHNRLGLIIVDEEHDASYKQTEPAPRYNGRDAAIMLADTIGANVLLGSATPSFETRYNVETGKYIEIPLWEKYHQGFEPKLEIIDMNVVHKLKNAKGSFSVKLLNEIAKTVERGEQAMIFRSRRAYSPIVQCTECGAVPKCPKCNVTLSYHKFNNTLECHYCGYRTKNTTVCPECKQRTLVNKGAGTEKIEEELEAYFPKMRIERFDADTISSKVKEQSLLKDFASGKIDVLVGTQMITKGFDFEKLSLVAVIQADSLFAVQDFRADERALQLLTQLRGRAGRRDVRGKMLVQTSQPDHPVIKALSDISQSMEERRLFSYPPYVRLVLITIKDKYEWRLAKISNDMAEAFRRCGIDNYSEAVVPAIDKVNGQTINQYWIKLKKNQSLFKIKSLLYDEIESIREKYKNLPTIIVDVDPY